MKRTLGIIIIAVLLFAIISLNTLSVGMKWATRALSYSAYERECWADSTEQHMAQVRTMQTQTRYMFCPSFPGSQRGTWVELGVDTVFAGVDMLLSDVAPIDSIIRIYHSYTHRTPTIEGYGAWVRERTGK